MINVPDSTVCLISSSAVHTAYKGGAVLKDFAVLEEIEDYIVE